MKEALKRLQLRTIIKATKLNWLALKIFLFTDLEEEKLREKPKKV